MKKVNKISRMVRTPVILLIGSSLLSGVCAFDFWGSSSESSESGGSVNSEGYPVAAPTAGYHSSGGRHDGWPAPYPTFKDTNGYSEWPSMSPTIAASKDPRNTHAPTVANVATNPVYLFPTTQYDDNYKISQFLLPTPTPTNIFAERTINLGIEIWSIAYLVEFVFLMVVWRCWVKCRTKSDPFHKQSGDGGGEFQRVRGDEDDVTAEEVWL